MRKKLISVLLSVTLVMVMAACGSTEESSGVPSSSAENNVESSVSTATDAPVVTEGPTVTDAPVETEAPAVTEAPTKEPTVEPTEAPSVDGGSVTGPTVDEFLACKFEVPVVESGIKGLYMGTYSFTTRTNRKMVISENQIDVYLSDGTHYTYTSEQISKDPQNDKKYVINDGSGATISIEDASSVNSDGSVKPYYFFRYSLGDKIEAIQGGMLEVFNGKHLYDISYDDMGEWGCIPVTDAIKEKLLSGLVTEDYRIKYSYKRQYMSEDSPYVQNYAINAYDIDGSSSETLYLKIYENEELAKQAYESSSGSSLLELDGNMVLSASCQNPLSTLSYYASYKCADLKDSVHGEHCTFDYADETEAYATYFVNPISLELGEEINEANELIALNFGEYSTEDYMGYVGLYQIYNGSEGHFSCSYTLADYSSIRLDGLLITDVAVEGNKITLVSNNCQEGYATLAELVIKDGTLEVTMKSYTGVDDLTIANSGSKTMTAERAFVVKKATY